MLYAEGETAPKMMSVGLHCRLVGRPGRAAALMRVSSTTSASTSGSGCRRGLQIAQHWHANLAHLADHAFDIG